MNKREKKKAIKADEIVIRRIVNEWNPIGVPVPEDEYDCLVQKLISKLYLGSSEKEIQIFIANEMRDHFGIKAEKTEIKEVAQDILKFWMSK